jgi:hypothetical protein
MNAHARWFGRAMWLGIVADWVLAVPTIFAPEAVLRTLGLRPTGDPVWTAFAALLVFLLSLFYIPAAVNPYRYRFNAWMAVFSRPPGVLFFLFLNAGYYPTFGLVDGSLFIIQFPLLLLAMRHRPPQPAPPVALQVPLADHSAVWLKRTLWLGIILDWLLGIPGIFFPVKLLTTIGARPTGDPVWTAFAALILVLLGIFYVPGANRPYQYRANAWLGVFARPPGVLFFLLLWRGYYAMFGMLDGALFLLQFPFLLKTLQPFPERRFNDVDSFDYHGSTFNEVKTAAFAGPYDGKLPVHKGLGPTTFLQLINDSSRNMFDRRDIRPRYDKLIHSNGICYAGTWSIDQDSPYTGYFAKGSQALVIARASVAGLFVTRGHRRAFGIGVKVFPTSDPNERVWPGNLVTVSHLSGSRAKHILDIDPLNYPTVGLDPASNMINRIIFRLVDTRPGYRQVYPVSTLGVRPGNPVVTPDMMMFKVADGTPRIDAKDFRDEIRLRNYPGQRLVYDILVKSFADSQWKRLGSMTFTEDAISEGGDKRLHFWIPKDIPNLNAPNRV